MKARHVTACMDVPDAAGKTYLVSDDENISTPALIVKLATAMGKSPRLFPCLTTLLNLAATLLNKRAEVMRLTGLLTVDSSRIRHELG